MAIKPETVPVSIRLPKAVLPDLDALATQNYQSRAGMISEIVLARLADAREKNGGIKRSARSRK